ncbi:related to high-affinity glucose transporter [Phialocephala subalpina]|uniref:Related to high-affinity glucose transporter n=1 Tax=Phialocephala subalpina TaxID=576137 RepID=A0A1L7WMP1_9HELO|nr:related to high-affinity glucose transporter [Phialocephala subalpina]
MSPWREFKPPLPLQTPELQDTPRAEASVKVEGCNGESAGKSTSGPSLSVALRESFSKCGAIGSALVAGSVVGSLMAGPISDKWGRRDSIFFACFWWLCGTAVQVSCKNFGQLIAGRILNGVCVGITSSQVPVYLAEIAKHDKRGSIIVIQQLAIEWGIFIMFFTGYGCSFIAGTASFRTAWGIQFIPALFLMAGLPFLPRSPRWLAKVGRNEEAIKTLAEIQANGDEHDPLVVAEWEEIWTVLQAERESSKGWRKLIYRGMWKRTLAGMSVQAWQQMSGGVDGNANVVIEVEGGPAHAIIAFCYILIIIYALTLVPVAWVYAAEVWSLETRATGMSLAAVANWLFNFALGLFVPPALRNITYKIFIVSGILCFGAAVQAFLTYPETCGKTLEEIELMFSKGGPRPWNTKPGGSRLDAEIAAVIERKTNKGEIYENRPGDDITEEKGTNITTQAQHAEA